MIVPGSQNDHILRALQAGRRLTAGEALTEFQCFRLASRITELRQMGYPIVSEPVKAPVSGKRIAEYHLPEGSVQPPVFAGFAGPLPASGAAHAINHRAGKN